VCHATQVHITIPPTIFHSASWMHTLTNRANLWARSALWLLWVCLFSLGLDGFPPASPHVCPSHPSATHRQPTEHSRAGSICVPLGHRGFAPIHILLPFYSHHSRCMVDTIYADFLRIFHPAHARISGACARPSALATLNPATRRLRPEKSRLLARHGSQIKLFEASQIKLISLH
jgi:hypothetical protein